VTRAELSVPRVGPNSWSPYNHIPSAETLSCDVKKVFAHVRKRIAKMLQVRIIQLALLELKCIDIPFQEHEGTLSFTTDAWTSPNHKAYVAITVHFEHEGNPIAMLLDLVEVAKSHSGVNLATAFAEVLEEFSVSDKVY